MAKHDASSEISDSSGNGEDEQRTSVANGGRHGGRDEQAENEGGYKI